MSNDQPAIVIVNRHEPENEVAARLIELAREKDYDESSVAAQRGEHDASLSFRVPQDVADEFNADRATRWPDKIENDGEKSPDQADSAAGVSGDAYAADATRNANAVRASNTDTEMVDDDGDPNTPPVRKTRSGNKA